MDLNPSSSSSYGYDPASVAGKAPPVDAQTDVLIVGAGPAGVACALAIATSGQDVSVTLVDENPVPLDTMGEDVPLHFGNRMGAAVANGNAMLEAMLEANPLLVDALEAGVDVRLGTAVWGLFPQRATTAWMDAHVAGLADRERVSLMRFRQVVVAAGRRDMGLAFDGWQLPGVMGVGAAWRLAVMYGALDAGRAVLVGSDTEALQAALELSARGVRIVAVIERRDTVTGDAALLAQLVQQGAQVMTGQVVRHAHGDLHGVKSVTLAPASAAESAEPVATFDCDTVLLGIAALPAIELLEAAGCTTAFFESRGGHIARVDTAQRTSLPFMLAVGDCAGVWSAKSLDADIARREGRIAAATVLAALNDGASTDAAGQHRLAWKRDFEPSSAAECGSGSGSTPAAACQLAHDRVEWVRASVLHASGEPFVCQCEEVTAAEILGVRPPRYLGWTPQPPRHTRDVAALVADGAPNPDTIKRLTRACMGPCQGRRCREQVAALLSIGAALPLAAIPLATFRTPVRPLALNRLAQTGESAALAEHWDSWFGMASQWVPFWRAQPVYTAASRETGVPVASE